VPVGALLAVKTAALFDLLLQKESETNEGQVCASDRVEQTIQYVQRAF